jgi:hypothetical protein
MSELLEREAEQDDGTQVPPIGHVLSPETRRALCGAELLGIKAFGEYVICPECLRLQREWGYRRFDHDVPF